MKTNRMLILLALLAVLCGQEAQAYYNPSTGRWLSRDPIQEAGGPNLYAFVKNRLPYGIDRLGLRPIHIEFNAFIPGPPDWLPEPGQPGPEIYWFSTDKRTFIRQPQQTARLRTELTLESTLIGYQPGNGPVRGCF